MWYNLFHPKKQRLNGERKDFARVSCFSDVSSSVSVSSAVSEMSQICQSLQTKVRDLKTSSSVSHHVIRIAMHIHFIASYLRFILNYLLAACKLLTHLCVVLFVPMNFKSNIWVKWNRTENFVKCVIYEQYNFPLGSKHKLSDSTSANMLNRPVS